MKPTVILVHGAYAESASWEGVVQLLPAEDVHLVAWATPLRTLSV